MSLNEKLVEIFQPFFARLDEAIDPPKAVNEILNRIMIVLDENEENFNVCFFLFSEKSYKTCCVE